MFLLNRHARRLENTRGDTIIEVMIVLAVLGLAISISYATANRSLLDARQGQENSQATELVQSQVEALQGLTPVDSFFKGISGAFCLNGSTPVAVPYPSDPSSHTWPASCVIDNLYDISVTFTSSFSEADNEAGWYGGKFIVQAQWPDVEGQGYDQVTMDYNLYSQPPPPTPTPTPGGGGGEEDTVPTPALTVSGGSGPIGGWTGNAYESGDTVTVIVSGVNSGDSCVFKNDSGDGSGTTVDTTTATPATDDNCTGSFKFSKFNSVSATNPLTAYVTDNGTSYVSNTVTLQSWANTPIYEDCSWDNGDHDVMAVDGNACPSGTSCRATGGVCKTYGTFGSQGWQYFDVPCEYNSNEYAYGTTWNGHDYTGTACPASTTDESRANLVHPPPDPLIPEVAEASGHEICEQSGAPPCG